MQAQHGSMCCPEITMTFVLSRVIITQYILFPTFEFIGQLIMVRRLQALIWCQVLHASPLLLLLLIRIMYTSLAHRQAVMVSTDFIVLLMAEQHLHKCQSLRIF